MKYHHPLKEVELKHNGRKTHKCYEEEYFWITTMETKIIGTTMSQIDVGRKRTTRA